MGAGVPVIPAPMLLSGLVTVHWVLDVGASFHSLYVVRAVGGTGVVPCLGALDPLILWYLPGVDVGNGGNDPASFF